MRPLATPRGHDPTLATGQDVNGVIAYHQGRFRVHTQAGQGRRQVPGIRLDPWPPPPWAETP